MTANAPTSVQVRMYNVGFGDCFLLSFQYPTGSPKPERHLLIDCGSTKQAARLTLAAIVDDINTRTKPTPDATHGHLDALVVTHRHADHLSAFGASGTQAVLENLSADLVIRPWVDQPNLGANADEGTMNFLGSLGAAQRFAGDLEAAIATARAGRTGTPNIVTAVKPQVANNDAIESLKRIANQAKQALYLSASPTPRTPAQLPGVTIHVLGPPTYKQLPEARRASSNYDGHYWFAQSELLETALAVAGLTNPNANAAARAALEAHDADATIGPASWLISKMQERHTQALERVVQVIDGALNNTSLVLLIEVGTKTMLFPGDAQGENWSWALEHAPDDQRAAWQLLLTDIDLYKVGHHGSRNATPKKLYDWWCARQRKLVSVMSTSPGKFKGVGTEVPRKTLVTALEHLGTLHRTDKPQAPLHVTVEADTTTDATFTLLH